MKKKQHVLIVKNLFDNFKKPFHLIGDELASVIFGYLQAYLTSCWSNSADQTNYAIGQRVHYIIVAATHLLDRNSVLL